VDSSICAWNAERDFVVRLSMRYRSTMALTTGGLHGVPGWLLLRRCSLRDRRCDVVRNELSLRHLPSRQRRAVRCVVHSARHKLSHHGRHAKPLPIVRTRGANLLRTLRHGVDIQVSAESHGDRCYDMLSGRSGARASQGSHVDEIQAVLGEGGG
jgi:hypothetical protein